MKDGSRHVETCILSMVSMGARDMRLVSRKGRDDFFKFFVLWEANLFELAAIRETVLPKGHPSDPYYCF